MASYSRDHELEADNLGGKLAGQSGYSPKSLAVILARLEQEDKLRTGDKMRPDFFSTHPATPKRVDALTRVSQKVQWRRVPEISRNQSNYLGLLNGLMVGTNPAEGVFVKEKFLHPELNLYMAFPKGWMTVNTRFAVGGISPTKDGILVLGPPKEGDDPEKEAKRLAQALYQRHRLKPNRARSLKINGRQAYVISYWDRSASDPVLLNFLWVKDRAGIYPLFGMAKKSQVEKLRSAAMSFRSLKPSERALIKETRVRIVSARAGESLSQLRRRTKSAWNDKTIAIFNGLSQNQKLKKGQLIKVAISGPYRSQTN
jgi:predicted Zn-dependent protease